MTRAVNWLLVALAVAMVTLPEPWSNVAMALVVLLLVIAGVSWSVRAAAGRH